MRNIAKALLGTLMLAGTAIGVSAPASAEWGVGIGVGPGYYGYYGPARNVCDPYSRWYNPYYCDDYDYYYGPPLYYGGYWYDHPLRSRWYGGNREFWINNGWRHGSFYRGGGRFEHGGGYGGGYGGGHGGGYGGGYGGGHGGGGYGGGHGGGGWGGGHGGGGYGGGHGGGGWGGGHGGHH